MENPLPKIEAIYNGIIRLSDISMSFVTQVWLLTKLRTLGEKMIKIVVSVERHVKY